MTLTPWVAEDHSGKPKGWRIKDDDIRDERGRFVSLEHKTAGESAFGVEHVSKAFAGLKRGSVSSVESVAHGARTWHPAGPGPRKKRWHQEMTQTRTSTKAGTWALKPKTATRTTTTRYAQGEGKLGSDFKVEYSGGGLTGRGKAAAGGVGAVGLGGANYGVNRRKKKT